MLLAENETATVKWDKVVRLTSYLLHVKINKKALHFASEMQNEKPKTGNAFTFENLKS